MRFTYGQVGNEPPVHLIDGDWAGPDAVPLSKARNTSLCGRPLAHRRKTPPPDSSICTECQQGTQFRAGIGVLDVSVPAALRGGGQLPDREGVVSHTETFPVTDEFAPEYEFMRVPLGELFVDPDLQRPEQLPWVKKIAKEFIPARFAEQPPKISERDAQYRGPGGEKYAVMDGQHEVQAARRAGFPPETLVPVHVYRDLTRQQEAIKFLNVNRGRKVVRGIDAFHVAVQAGDPNAVLVQQGLDHYGWTAKSSGAEGGLAAVVHLQRLASQSAVVLDRVLSTITGAWGNRAGIQGPIVAALGLIYSRARSEGLRVDPDARHMTIKLKTVTPESVLAAARSIGPGTPTTRAANYIIGEYNKNLRKTPRLDPFQ
jgi:hypothetical protein